MATAKYGAIITDIKGSVGGTTFKGTRAGAVLQNKITHAPAGAASGKITKADAGRAINNFSTITRAWRTIPTDAQLAWNSFAPSYPFKNKFGEDYTASGFQCFVSLNQNIITVNGTILEEPPDLETIPPTPDYTVQIDIGGGTITVNYDNDNTDWYFVIYMTRPLPDGKQPNKRDYRLVAVITTNGSVSEHINEQYTKVFGSVDWGGNIFCGCKITKADAGFTSTTVYALGEHV